MRELDVQAEILVLTALVAADCLWGAYDLEPARLSLEGFCENEIDRGFSWRVHGLRSAVRASRRGGLRHVEKAGLERNRHGMVLGQSPLLSEVRCEG